jgi:hypothetical protein
MNYAVSAPAQLRSAPRAMRDSRGLRQAHPCDRIGVSQRRIATFDQLSRIVAALGGRLVIDDPSAKIPAAGAKKRPAKAAFSEKADW